MIKFVRAARVVCHALRHEPGLAQVFGITVAIAYVIGKS